ncbi:MAG: choice-of-anchor L domain-containing protein [Thermoplasmatota archaeon]
MNNKKIKSLIISTLVILTLFISSPLVLEAQANQQKAYDMAMAILANSSSYISSSYSDTDPHGTRQGAVISTSKGDFPTIGSKFVILSTGTAGTSICTTDELDQGCERGTFFNGKYDLPRDQATLTITLQVPLFMHQISYDVQFLTSEYPEYLNSQYNDKFTATVDSPSMGISQYIIDVNGGDFVLDSNDITGTGFDIYAVNGNPYDGVNLVTRTPNNAPDAGATALISRQHPVSPGEIITITFDIVDTGDNQFDSAVFIDNLDFTDEKRTEMIGRKTATDLNGGDVECGDEIRYTITLSNIGTKAQLDLDGPEFVDLIPENTTYVPESVTATSGTAEYVSSENRVVWNGEIPAESSVKIEFNVLIDQGLPNKAEIFNQGVIYWDKNSTGHNTDTELTDDPTVPGNHQPTILYVYVLTPPEKLIEVFSDAAGGKAVESFDNHQWFETSTIHDIGIFAVANSYHYSRYRSFKIKLRSVSNTQYWTYDLLPLNAQVSSWEVMFTCGNTIEPYKLYLDFTNEHNQIIARLKFDYQNDTVDGMQEYIATLYYMNSAGMWTQIKSDNPEDNGYLYNDWYKLNITMQHDNSLIYELYRNNNFIAMKTDAGYSSIPFSQLSTIAWYSTDTPLVCPMLFFDEHILYLQPL